MCPNFRDSNRNLLPVSIVYSPMSTRVKLTRSATLTTSSIFFPPMRRIATCGVCKKWTVPFWHHQSRKKNLRIFQNFRSHVRKCTQNLIQSSHLDSTPASYPCVTLEFPAGAMSSVLAWRPDRWKTSLLTWSMQLVTLISWPTGSTLLPENISVSKSGISLTTENLSKASVFKNLWSRSLSTCSKLIAFLINLVLRQIKNLTQ